MIVINRFTASKHKTKAPGHTRRAFLKSTLSMIVGGRIVWPQPLFGQARPSKPVAWTQWPDEGSHQRLPRVVQINDERIIPVRIVQQSLLKDYLEDGLRLLTGTHSTADAWHEILKPEDIILIKFNQSGARTIGTTPFMAKVLVDSLIHAGWSGEQILLLEASGTRYAGAKLRQPDYRWQDEIVQFGESGQDSFLAALDQATAIINVPFLKTHHRAIMTCCLKNLSHGLIRHPSRFHAHRCHPAIAQIVASEPIRSKLKLNIVNGLRTVFRRGPEAGEKDIATTGMLLIGQDPLACDAVGYGILNEVRSLYQLRPLLPNAGVPGFFAMASKLGVGHFDMDSIDLQRLPA